MTRTDLILEWVKGPKVLDVGCTGHQVEAESKNWLFGALNRNFPYVVGIDISENNINKLRSIGFEKVYVQSAESITLEEKFDTIVAGELIEHLSNPGLFFIEARKHLIEGGRLIITSPNSFALMHSLYAFIKYPITCQNDEHTCWFCPQTLRTLFTRYHFQEIYFDLIPNYSDDEKSLGYRIFVWLIRTLGFLLPKLLKNNAMIFVLET